MTLPPKRPDDPIPRIPDEQRILGSYELQLRNVNGIQRHARPIVERLEGQRGQTEQAALLLDHIDTCNLDNWITTVSALRRGHGDRAQIKTDAGLSSGPARIFT